MSNFCGKSSHRTEKDEVRESLSPHGLLMKTFLTSHEGKLKLKVRLNFPKLDVFHKFSSKKNKTQTSGNLEGGTKHRRACNAEGYSSAASSPGAVSPVSHLHFQTLHPPHSLALRFWPLISCFMVNAAENRKPRGMEAPPPSSRLAKTFLPSPVFKGNFSR